MKFTSKQLHKFCALAIEKFMGDHGNVDYTLEDLNVDTDLKKGNAELDLRHRRHIDGSPVYVHVQYMEPYNMPPQVIVSMEYLLLLEAIAVNPLTDIKENVTHEIEELNDPLEMDCCNEWLKQAERITSEYDADPLLCLIDDFREYMCVWGKGYAKKAPEILNASFFCTEEGFKDVHLASIDKLQLGESHTIRESDRIMSVIRTK